MSKRETSDYFRLKYDALYDAYKKALARSDVRSHEEAIFNAINSPTTRYWISIGGASRNIARILKGKPVLYKEGSVKHELLMRVYQEYLRLSKSPLFRGSSIYFITSFAVMKPADKFYISYRSARRIISRHRRKE